MHFPTHHPHYFKFKPLVCLFSGWHSPFLFLNCGYSSAASSPQAHQQQAAAARRSVSVVPVKANQISIHVEDRSLVFGITLSCFKSSTARSKAFTPHLSAISGQLSADDLHHACNVFSSSCLVRKNTHSSLFHTLESPFIFKHIGSSVNLLHFPGMTFRHNLTSFNPLKIIVIFLSINE